MTYFSDYDHDYDYYNDENLRKEIFRQMDDAYLNPYYETVPEALLQDLFDE